MFTKFTVKNCHQQRITTVFVVIVKRNNFIICKAKMVKNLVFEEKESLKYPSRTRFTFPGKKDVK